VLTPSFALIGGGSGGPTRLDRILAELARRLDEPLPRADQLVATRGNTCVVLTAVPGGDERDPAGRWCLHLPLSPSQRAQIERHHEIVTRMPSEHPEVPVPEPLFIGELERAFVACERRLGGFNAPHVPYAPDTSANLLADAARHLARLVVAPARPLDEEGFERLVGRKLDLVAEHAHVASTVANLARLRDEAREALLGEPLPEVLYHADLRGKHLQIDREGRVIGFLDWGSAEDRGLPYFDLLHLLVHERKQERDLSAEAAWLLARDRTGLREREAAALESYAAALGLSEAVRRTVEAIYPALVGAMAESNWDYSRPRWVHRQFGL
jgi:aminoglycoside phosphotransferase (APT) family kinase protein